MEIQKGIAEQVRGMKVRSSVKKLCSGCKVCFAPLLLGLWNARRLMGLGRKGSHEGLRTKWG
jgi:hypothetical protein